MKENLLITSPDFENQGKIPLKNTARGEDISPEFNLSNIDKEAKSIAITMDDYSHPLFPNYNHWVIWNIPVSDKIPSSIPKGKEVESLKNARQGLAYGKNCYKGPKPPYFLKGAHKYVFTFYTLKCLIDLKPESTKEDLLRVIEGKILQTGKIEGNFENIKK